MGAIYARYSTKFQDSVADQVRSLLDAAVCEGIFVPRELVFFDTAKRGYSNRRPGLNGLRAALGVKSFQALLVFATNRLFRKTYKALQFVEEELVERGVRCIFVNSRVDTSDGNRWRTLLQFHATMDEMAVGMYADNIRAAHGGLFLRRMVCQTLPLGYTGEEVPGEQTRRKKPRRRVIVDQNASPWIQKIFEWYVHDLLTITGIAQRLNNDPNAPLPAKSIVGHWTHQTVRTTLTNPCYRGRWAYGRKETKWQSKKDYARQFPREKPLQEAQFEELRIISDELWLSAQQRLANHSPDSGRNRKCSEGPNPPRLLRGLFWCPEHDRALTAGGPQGNSLVCPGCRMQSGEKRPLFTHLNRKLALSMTCRKLAELVRADVQFVEEVIAACQRTAGVLQAPDPTMLTQLKHQKTKLNRSIEFAIRNVGESHEEQAAASALVRSMRKELTDVVARINQVEAAQHRVIKIPTADEVQAMLCKLGELLELAGSGTSGEAVGAAREIIMALTGGRIELVQMGERRSHGGWLQGKFQLHLLDVAVSRFVGAGAPQAEQRSFMTIDYRQPFPREEQSERAKELYDAGLQLREIAKEMKCSQSRLTFLVRFWFQSRGLPVPDSRKRSAMLGKLRGKPLRLHERIAEAVMALYDSPLHLQEIAARLGVGRDTVTKAVAYWHSTRSLPIPDGRTRLKDLARQSADTTVVEHDANS